MNPPRFARKREHGRPIAMLKAVLLILCGLGFAISVGAQAPVAPTAALRTPEELDELLGPIALYPDPLIALILPASTVPADLARAAAFLNANGAPAQIASQPWDDSVKSLAHYPDVLKWMNDNLPWTQEVGDAFIAQQRDVMNSIQQLRARAVAAGSLVNSPQQQVITDGGEIRIVPAQSDVVYVPTYDPDVVYEEQPGFAGPWMTFGVGYPAGVWFNYDLDWLDFGIWVGAWHPGFDWRHPVWRHPVGVVPVGGHPWQLAPGRRPAVLAAMNRGRPEIVHPKPLPGAPARPPMRSPAVAPASRPVAGPPVRPDLRGYPPARSIARPSTPPASAFGGYHRGSEVRAFSQRGQASRQMGGAAGGRSAAPGGGARRR
jgi:hypothetical protein